jgi:hypothetical protein
VLISSSESLTIQVVKNLKLAIFTWRGSPTPDTYKDGTIQSLETLRDNPSVNRIVLNARAHSGMTEAYIATSVKSTVDYLAIARGSYRMAVVPPVDPQSKHAVNLYVAALNKVLKKRFVVIQKETMSEAFQWLIHPKKFWLFNS